MIQASNIGEATKIAFKEQNRADLIGMINNSGKYNISQTDGLFLTNPPDDMPTTDGEDIFTIWDGWGQGTPTRKYPLPLAVVKGDHVKFVNEGRPVIEDYHPDLKETIEGYIAQIELTDN